MNKFLNVSLSIFAIAITSCTPQNQKNEFEVRWVNYDDTVLAQEVYKHGETPLYKGTTPTREGTYQYTFEFNGWSPDVTPVNKDVTYKATYSETVNRYTITWKNYDGEILDTEVYDYAAQPVYKGSEPEKPKDAQYTYHFSGWDPLVQLVWRDTEYTATYTTTINQYTVTWKNYDGETIGTEQYNYGVTPSYKGSIPEKEHDEQYYYSFDGWNEPLVPVVGDATYTAKYVPIEGYVFKRNSDNKSYSIIGYSLSESEDIVFPDTFSTLPITNITKGLLDGYTSVKSLRLPVLAGNYLGYIFGANQAQSQNSVIPSSLTSVYVYYGDVGVDENYGGFYNCSNIQTLEFGKEVKFISTDAFYGCSSLESITVSDDNKYYRSDHGALYKTSDNSLVHIPAKAEVFYIPRSITKLEGTVLFGEYTSDPYISNLQSKYSNIKKIVVPDSITSIGKAAFAYTNFEEIEISNKTISLGNGAFFWCEQLKSFEIPASVKVIDDNCFYGCGLTEITIPNGIKTLGYSALRRCLSLKTVNLPDSIIDIGGCCFTDSAIEHIKLPNNVVSIGFSAFSNSKLKDIIVPSGVKNINESCFENCTELEFVKLEQGVENIGFRAFYADTLLANVVLPVSIKLVEENAFKSNPINHFFYEGNEFQFQKITCQDVSINDHHDLVYYYSEENPGSSGHYWHYVDDVPTVW